jgi:hypothetical protein
VTDTEDVVTGWLNAYQARDLAGLLARAHTEIVMRPFRWVPRTEYRGHDGVRAWLADTIASPHVGGVTIARVQTMDPACVVVEGTLDDDGTAFTAFFQLRDGQIAGAVGYLSERAFVEQLGVLRDAAG